MEKTSTRHPAACLKEKPQGATHLRLICKGMNSYAETTLTGSAQKTGWVDFKIDFIFSCLLIFKILNY
jgi:hypothetical protein